MCGADIECMSMRSWHASHIRVMSKKPLGLAVVHHIVDDKMA